MAKGYTHITTEQMDRVIKLAYGPRKMGATEIGAQMGLDRSNVCAVIRAYNLVAEGDLDVIAEKLVGKSITQSAVEWAFDYHGKEIPADLRARVEAKRRGDAFRKDEQPPEVKKVEEANLAVLCGRINALGQAISDCLTESTAAKLTDKITVALKEGQASANANADMILAEMKKQTDLLQRIEMNTKKLRRDIQA